MPQQSLAVLYGTETGNARDVAEWIVWHARCHFASSFASVRWGAMDDYSLAEWRRLSATHVFVFVCSTTGQGDTPATMRRSWDELLLVDCIPFDDGLRFGVFGLGDSSYAKYNFAAKKLRNRLRQLGANALMATGLADDQDGNGIDEALNPWLAEFWEVALDGGDPQHQGEEGAFAARPAIERVVPIAIVTDVQEDLEAEPTNTVGESSTFVATVRSVERLTAIDHFQTVSEVALDLQQDGSARSSCTFVPQQLVATDAVGIYPNNAAEDVQYLAGLYKDPVISVRPNSEAYEAQPTEQWLATGSPTRLSRLLAENFDLAATAKRALFAVLRGMTADEDEQERLDELAQKVPEYDRYCWREKRSTVEVLRDFAFLGAPPLAALLTVLPRLAPRYYSISSLPQRMDDVGGASVTLTVALLQFITPMQRERFGIASKQLVDAKCGARFRGELRRGPGLPPTEPSSRLDETDGSLAADPSGPAPLLLIGPGTGIAPCRSLWREVLESAVRIVGEVTVVTGNRSRSKDFLYGEELTGLSSTERKADADDARTKTSLMTPLVRHIAAFSREKPQAHPYRYAQHALVGNASHIAAVLRHPRAVVYICGNSKQMPQDVEAALASIVKARVLPKPSPAEEATTEARPLGADEVADAERTREAAAYIRRMKSAGRYITDTW